MLGVSFRRRPQVRGPIRQHLLPHHRLLTQASEGAFARTGVNYVQEDQTERWYEWQESAGMICYLAVNGEWRFIRSCAFLGEPGVGNDERYCIHRSGTYNIHVEYCTCRKKDGCNHAMGVGADWGWIGTVLGVGYFLSRVWSSSWLGIGYQQLYLK